jgi:hypothetical protein
MSSAHDDFSKTEILENEPPPRRRLPRPLLLAALTAVVVTGGAGVAAATADSPSPGSPAPTATASGDPSPSGSPSTGSPPPSQSPSPGQGEGRSPRHWGWGHLLFGPGIHGEYVVRGEQEGQWITVAKQIGEVTAVDQDSVTVRSEDGYTREYVVNSETRINSDQGISAIQVGHKVAVTATVEGGTATARTILDSQLRRERPWHHKRWGDRDRWGGRGWGDRDGDRGRGEPEASPSASPTSTA